MTFEVLIFPNSWFKARSKYVQIQKLINKAYDKPRYKFGIIKSPRIFTESSLFQDLAISPLDEFNFYLLLGDEQFICDVEKAKGSKRDFDEDGLENCYNCDIPAQFVNKFDFSLLLEETKITVVDESFEFDEGILARSLASLGLKTYHGDLFQEPRTKAFELTALTSFLNGSASKFLDFVLAHIVQSPVYFQELSLSTSLDQLSTIIIHADYIVEHNLENYYINKCGFVKLPEENIYMPLGNGGKATYMHEGKVVEALKDFHIAFVYRSIHVASRS